MANPAETEILQLSQRLLDSIAQADWSTYQTLCDSGLTAFEPEAQGQLVEGLEFHEFYFQLGPAKGKPNTTMVSPRVRILGEVALVTYVRLNQRVNADGAPVTSAFEETRVWQRKNGEWKHIHFHRSAVS